MVVEVTWYRDFSKSSLRRTAGWIRVQTPHVTRHPDERFDRKIEMDTKTWAFIDIISLLYFMVDDYFETTRSFLSVPKKLAFSACVWNRP